MVVETLEQLCGGLQLNPLPPLKKRSPARAHAPVRNHKLSSKQQKLALRNALRYFPMETHPQLAPEFAEEFEQFGHIYMYRFMPDIEMKAYPLTAYPSRCRGAAAVMLMIMNNLDPAVAQFPEELVTYGGNGQVFSNWAQFRLVMHYLSTMTEEQTLVLNSGHPLGLFPSSPASPRVIITNGMVIPNYSTKDHYDDMFALGVTMYGQMTAGSFCYIGPQGIVHGTTLTVLNAGRQYLGSADLAGKVFVTSGLGGMSGAQAKAAVVCGCIGVIAESSEEALLKRHRQGWLQEYTSDLDQLIILIRQYRQSKKTTSIGFLGNIVLLWERLLKEYEKTGELLVDLGSDQTSCHNPYRGGYTPLQLSYEESNKVLAEDPERFKVLVQETLRRHVAAINKLSDAGMFFWDYGNAFLLEAGRAGADVYHPSKTTPTGGRAFRYPSYVQDIMGDIFSLGFGPFRWVCTSGSMEDLKKTDEIALEVLREIQKEDLPKEVAQQYEDNERWLSEAGGHHLTVGSAARILYADQRGRCRIAAAFNEAVASGTLQSGVVISRDHHDVSGTDSPFRETANITDGSSFTADMAVQTMVGNATRGATWVALHNGGGVGWGEVINGGFGLLLDGSEEAGRKAGVMLAWDVSNGVARRCWSGNSNAQLAIKGTMARNPLLRVTLPHAAADEVVDAAMK